MIDNNNKLVSSSNIRDLDRYHLFYLIKMVYFWIETYNGLL